MSLSIKLRSTLGLVELEGGAAPGLRQPEPGDVTLLSLTTVRRRRCIRRRPGDAEDFPTCWILAGRTTNSVRKALMGYPVFWTRFSQAGMPAPSQALAYGHWASTSRR